MIPQENIAASPASLDRFASHGNVTYSCGHCGYALNLCSSHRNTTNIGSKYGKTISRGVLTFYSIDDSRFSRMDELRCLPYFRAKNSWGILRRRTKLLCGKCRTCIGTAYDMASGSTSDSGSSKGFGKKYNIRISALQPSSFDESGIPLFT
ncbi:hypothetical protein J5N97_002266 [Dioscorea zingiberensis]|uniref:Uncharacterized protein n=1 Tax=Dioscorea zingiberensis TaxID=325984 RepID=A0A9D5HP20_9LILI|nr:hypothetical protein J5N97_002266 [Dioscorea zingiberensis]